MSCECFWVSPTMHDAFTVFASSPYNPAAHHLRPQIEVGVPFGVDKYDQQQLLFCYWWKEAIHLSIHSSMHIRSERWWLAHGSTLCARVPIQFTAESLLPCGRNGCVPNKLSKANHVLLCTCIALTVVVGLATPWQLLCFFLPRTRTSIPRCRQNFNSPLPALHRLGLTLVEKSSNVSVINRHYYL